MTMNDEFGMVNGEMTNTPIPQGTHRSFGVLEYCVFPSRHPPRPSCPSCPPKSRPAAPTRRADRSRQSLLATAEAKRRRIAPSQSQSNQSTILQATPNSPRSLQSDRSDRSDRSERSGSRPVKLGQTNPQSCHTPPTRPDRSNPTDPVQIRNPQSAIPLISSTSADFFRNILTGC